MTIAPVSKHRNGLKTARLLMVLSSMSPLFILWAIRGNSLIPDTYFIGFCALIVIVPNAFLWLRIHTTKRNNDMREVAVGIAEDNRDNILVYLFAMLLPFYSESLGTMRDLASTLTALAFIVFLFWHLDLHYMNLLFAARGYRVFTVYPPTDCNPLTGKTRYAVITRRSTLSTGDKFLAYRLSNSVYMEAK